VGAKGRVPAADRMTLIRQVCLEAEIVVSTLRLIPLRAKHSQKEHAGKPANEESIKKASEVAAEEILALAKKDNAYERSLIEIAVARTLRGIIEGGMPA